MIGGIIAIALVAWLMFWPGVAVGVWLGRVTAREGLSVVVGLPFFAVTLVVVVAIAVVGAVLQWVGDALGWVGDSCLDAFEWLPETLRKIVGADE